MFPVLEDLLLSCMGICVPELALAVKLLKALESRSNVTVGLLYTLNVAVECRIVPAICSTCTNKAARRPLVLPDRFQALQILS